MAQPFAAGFYHSEAWANAREQALKRDRYLCVECLKKGIITAATTVHHIVHLNERNIRDARIAIALDNLESVCTDCHAAVHADDHRKEKQKRYKVGEDGKIISS